MAGDPWEEGPLGDAFDVDTSDVKSAANKKPPTPKKTSSSSKPPKPGTTKEQNFENGQKKAENSDEVNVESEYPSDTKGEAVESLKRAASVEDYENFKKVASAIEEEHPDALNDVEQLEKVSYIVGRNMAEGIYDELQDKA